MKSYRLLCGLVTVLCLSGLTQAQNCPCWTPEQLAAIWPSPPGVDDCCLNHLDMTDASSLTCTAINVSPDECDFGWPQHGWVMAWNGIIGADLGGPGCYMRDYDQDIYVFFCPGELCDGPITADEVMSCAQEIAAFGESYYETKCTISEWWCETDSECPDVGTCSVIESYCSEGDGCQPVGNCAMSQLTCYWNWHCAPGSCLVGGEPCHRDEDCAFPVCEGFEPCENLQSQTCDGPFEYQSCGETNPVGHCFPPGCPLLWNDAKSEIAFTKQPFFLSVGDVSEMLIDEGFSGAECHGPFAWFADDLTSDPDSDEARYYLGRAAAGVSCLDHGDSTFDPDPRDALDWTCP